MEATRLAPAGRACSKFIWQQCRFQKNWAVRVLPRSGRPAFLVVPKFWRDRSQTAPSPSLTSTLASLSGPIESDGSAAPCVSIPRRQPCAIHVTLWRMGRPPDRFLRRRLATLSPRLGVTSGGRNMAGRRRLRQRVIDCASRRRRRAASVSARGGRNSLANSKRSRVNGAQQARWLGNVLPPRWVSAFKTRNLLLSATE
jgi:hypothetical protein